MYSARLIYVVSSILGYMIVLPSMVSVLLFRHLARIVSIVFVDPSFYEHAPSSLCFDVEAVLTSHPRDTEGSKEKGQRNRAGKASCLVDKALGAEVGKRNDVRPHGDVVDGGYVQIVARVYAHDGGDDSVGAE